MDGTTLLQNLKQRLAEVTTDAERLTALLDFDLATIQASRTESRPVLEAEPYLREAVELARKVGTPRNLVRAGIAASEFYRDIGEMTRSLECANAVKEAADSSGNPVQLGQHFFLLGRIRQEQGDYKRAGECYERCLSLWREAGYEEGVGAALNQLGGLAGIQGHEAEALQRFHECLKIDDKLNDVSHQATHKFNVGWALQRLGQWDDAESCYRALAISEERQMQSLRASVLTALGELFLERDKTVKAIDMFRMAIESTERGVGTLATHREAMANLGLGYFRMGDYARAQHTYDQALVMADRTGDRPIAAMVLWRLAELALAQGQMDRCRDAAQRSAAVAGEVGVPSQEAQAARVLGLLHAARGERPQARAAFEHAMELLRDLDEGLDLARVRFHYGRYLLAQGEKEPALALLKAASRAFRKLGIISEAHEVDRLLFQQERGSSRDMALLSAVSGLVSLGVEPRVLLERAIGLLREALGFDGAAVVVSGRPVLLTGGIVMKQTPTEAECEEPVSTERLLCWLVRYRGKPLGRIHLERAEPAASEYNPVVLDTVANLLAAPIRRLAELEVDEAEVEPALARLRYKGLVGRNQRMIDVLKTVCAVADKSVPVLIHGESGTGKELIARALHDSSTRRDKPFVAVNCAAVPDNLLEAEFFGIEKGTATGVAAHKGKFEIAHGGTIFLDEIGDMSLSLQSKLLRVLQEKTFERVGGHVPISVDVRVVAATNQPVAELMEQKKFREDLYYRLNTVELQLPSLSERAEDIPDFVRYFVRNSNQEFGRDVTEVSPEAMSQLTLYHWPGNIRELAHVVERTVLLARGSTLELFDLPVRVQPAAGSESGTSRFRAVRHRTRERAAAGVERTAIIDCLERAGWNVERAAKLAGYSRAQFYRLMRKHSISRSTH